MILRKRTSPLRPAAGSLSGIAPGVWLMILLLIAGCASVGSRGEESQQPSEWEMPTEAELRQLHVPQDLPALLPPAPPQTEPKYFVHTVRSEGETLMAISRWFTGDGNNWPNIAQANQDLDPLRIGIGTTILIPENMLVTREAMPKSALPVQSKKKKSAPPSRPPSSSIKEPQLFGPIESTPKINDDSKLAHPLQTLD